VPYPFYSSLLITSISAMACVVITRVSVIARFYGFLSQRKKRNTALFYFIYF